MPSTIEACLERFPPWTSDCCKKHGLSDESLAFTRALRGLLTWWEKVYAPVDIFVELLLIDMHNVVRRGKDWGLRVDVQNCKTHTTGLVCVGQ